MQMGAAQPPATGIGGAIQNAMRMLVGGAMSGGQGKAQQRARDETMQGLELANAMKQKSQQALAPQMMPGTSPMGMPNIGAQEVSIAAETKQEFLSRKEQAKLKALMSSEIPEYRAMGEQMMIQALTATTPGVEFLKSGDDWLVGDPTTGNVGMAYQADEKFTTEQYDDDKSIYKVGDDGSIEQVRAALRPPKKDAPKHRKVPLPGGKTGYEDWNETSEAWEFSGLAPDPSAVAEVNVTLPGEPTKAHTTKLQEKSLETSMGLTDLYTLYDRVEDEGGDADEWFTYAGKGKNWLRQFAEKLGAELSDKDLEELSSYAGFQTHVRRMTNTYIQRITGAQVSAHEVERLLGAIPNLGDSKTVFMAKLRYVTESTEETNRAYMEALQGYGFSPHQWARGEVPDDVAEQAKMAATVTAKARNDEYESRSNRDWKREGTNSQRERKIRKSAAEEEKQRAIAAGETVDLEFEVGRAGG